MKLIDVDCIWLFLGVVFWEWWDGDKILISIFFRLCVLMELLGIVGDICLFRGYFYLVYS